MDKKQKIKEEVVSDLMEDEKLEDVTVDEEKDLDDKKFVALNEKVAESEDKYRRALADYQNLQKRVQEDKQDWIRSANKELLLRLLPVLDTLMLASKHVEDKGLMVSINLFFDTLKSEGVTRIETVGKEFNPHLMECVVTEEGEEGKVLEELRVGYTLNDKVLRPAQVKVGKGK